MARPARRPRALELPGAPTHCRSIRYSLRCRSMPTQDCRTTKRRAVADPTAATSTGEDRGIGWVRPPWNQLASAVVVLQLGAGIIGYVVGETVEAIAILVILVTNTIVGFSTELQAARSMAALRELGTVAEVERDDRRDEIDATELVPGDIVGIEAEGLQVEEAGMTGGTTRSPRRSRPSP